MKTLFKVTIELLIAKKPVQYGDEATPQFQFEGQIKKLIDEELGILCHHIEENNLSPIIGEVVVKDLS